LYVVRHNYTLMEHLRNVKELKFGKRIANLSLIYNGVSTGSAYGYGYGYYGEETEGPHTSLGSKIKKEPLSAES
jgi:tyrosine-protein kinase Etk/Wzc